MPRAELESAQMILEITALPIELSGRILIYELQGRAFYVAVLAARFAGAGFAAALTAACMA